jgi:hypothetical protein
LALIQEPGAIPLTVGISPASRKASLTVKARISASREIRP